jgi:hypothetical protein
MLSAQHALRGSIGDPAFLTRQFQSASVNRGALGLFVFGGVIKPSGSGPTCSATTLTLSSHNPNQPPVTGGTVSLLTKNDNPSQ